MTEIRPFRSVCYNSEKVPDLSKVICPPYDVISEEQREEYSSLSKENFVRVLLGKDLPGDNKQKNKYTRAKDIFEQWLEKGIVKQDDQPCIYFYRQEYMVMGVRHSRLGFIYLMKVEDDDSKKIFPHEKTHSEAKEDRLKLWKTLSCNLSPIFVCFSDKDKKIEKTFTKHVEIDKPFIDVKDEEGIRHLVWRLSDPALIDDVAGVLFEQHLFIADGHHRYEVAKELRKLNLAKVDKPTGQEPFQYLMTYLTNMDSKDLQIFPMHRIVRHLSQDMDFINEFFRVDKMKTKEELSVLLTKAGFNEHAFGLHTQDGILLLRLKNKQLIEEKIPEGSPAFKRLDATILKYFILDPLGVKSEDIIYTKDINYVTQMVDEGQADAGFIMNPVKIEELKEIALNGERMPPKTTYFYPKVLSGLTINKLK